MIGDASDVDRGAILDCDVCIVGAGPAGITLARELGRTRLETIVLESGGTGIERAIQGLNVGELRGAPQFSTAASRLRVLGGTTGHWSGMCRPLEGPDFEERPWVPHSGWPISRADLDRFYERAHPICELGPYDYSRETWPQVLRDEILGGDEDAGFVLVQLSPPTRFGRRYRRELRDATKLRVLLHSTVRELVPDAEGRSIQRAEVRTLGGHGFRVRARAFVLACGGIENARLLLLSTGAGREGLGNRHGWVGRCFMDHPAAQPLGTLLFLRDDARALVQRQTADGVKVMVGLRLRSPVRRENELLDSVLYVGRPERVDGAPGIPDEVRRSMRFLAGGTAPGVAASCWLRSEQAPNPESRVSLGDETDALGQPTLRLDWRFTEVDHLSLVRSARLYAAILGRTGLGRIKFAPWIESERPKWWRHLKPGWHHMGTTRMAADPTRGVVDTNGRVFDVDNLFVAGSSVFPTSGVAPPTLTIIALALRLAEHLETRLA